MPVSTIVIDVFHLLFRGPFSAPACIAPHSDVGFPTNVCGKPSSSKQAHGLKPVATCPLDPSRWEVVPVGLGWIKQSSALGREANGSVPTDS